MLQVYFNMKTLFILNKIKFKKYELINSKITTNARQIIN
jgi:hypothetical protein